MSFLKMEGIQTQAKKYKIALVYPYFKKDTYLLGWPLGLGYISAFLKASNHEAKVFHAKDYDCSKEQMLDAIQEFHPHYVGLYSNYALRYECISFLKLLNENGYKTIAGGPDPTLRPELYVGKADFVIRGEGEYIFSNFLSNGEKPVKGMAYMENSVPVILEREENVQDLDLLPFPEQPAEYQAAIMTSRSCPFNCTFCQPTLHLLFGKTVRFRTAKNVVDEIESYYSKGITRFFFLDENFTVYTPHLKSICEEIRQRNMKISWYTQARVNTIDEEKIKILKDAGCTELKFGVESGSQRILTDIYNKGITLDQIRKAFALCQKYGLLATAYIMIGAPTETKEDFEATLRLLQEIEPDGIHVSITTILPNTQLYDKFEHMLTAEEKIHTLSFASDNPSLCLKWVGKSVTFDNILDYKARYLQVVVDKAHKKAKQRKIQLFNMLFLIYLRIILGRAYLKKCIDACVGVNGDLRLGTQRVAAGYERVLYHIFNRIMRLS